MQEICYDGTDCVNSMMGGQQFVTTIDPVNFQAFLAKQFNDYDLGEIRRNGMSPLMGRGIVGIFSRS